MDENDVNVDIGKRATARAIRMLRAYAAYLNEHAENIIGDIDKPNYVGESGIRVSFVVNPYNDPPIVTVTKEYLPINVVDEMCMVDDYECN